jgi:hypothetical protein
MKKVTTSFCIVMVIQGLSHAASSFAGVGFGMELFPGQPGVAITYAKGEGKAGASLMVTHDGNPESWDESPVCDPYPECQIQLGSYPAYQCQIQVGPSYMSSSCGAPCAAEWPEWATGLAGQVTCSDYACTVGFAAVAAPPPEYGGSCELYAELRWNFSVSDSLPAPVDLIPGLLGEVDPVDCCNQCNHETTSMEGLCYVSYGFCKILARPLK